MTTTTSKAARILLVDDQAQELLSLRQLVTSAGHQVSCAASGAEALERLAEIKPSLVVLDVVMPGLDGPATLVRLKRLCAPALIPVLMLSTRATPEMRADLLNLGADDVLARPYDQVELLARIHALLRLKGLHDKLLAEKTALERLAITDGLTGLYNHRHFQERIQDEVRRSLRYAQPLSLLLLDLDRFKAVNDHHGHPAGDAALRHVASILGHQVRETDVVARYGGEEFAVILPQTPRTGAEGVAHRIGHELESSPFRAPKASITLTASIGVSHLPTAGITSAERLISAADDALYKAKAQGRNQVVLAGARSAARA